MLLFTIFVIVVTQNLVLQQSKNVTAKCTKKPIAHSLYSIYSWFKVYQGEEKGGGKEVGIVQGISKGGGRRGWRREWE